MAKSIKLGSSNITINKIKLGSSDVDKVYLGSTQILPVTGYVFNTKAALASAIRAWYETPTYALTTYGEINTWNVSALTDMSELFLLIPSTVRVIFDEDISNWDVSNVTDFSWMFVNTISFNQDIGDWDVSSAVDMEGMFAESRRFNGDISSWDVSSVTNMKRMFNGASDFDQNISSWDISSVTTMDQMFDRGVENQHPLSSANYNALLIGWSSQTVQSNVVLGADGLTYFAGAGATARGVLTSSPNNWIISDGGQL